MEESESRKFKCPECGQTVDVHYKLEQGDFIRCISCERAFSADKNNEVAIKEYVCPFCDTHVPSNLTYGNETMCENCGKDVPIKPDNELGKEDEEEIRFHDKTKYQLILEDLRTNADEVEKESEKVKDLEEKMKNWKHYHDSRVYMQKTKDEHKNHAGALMLGKDRIQLSSTDVAVALSNILEYYKENELISLASIKNTRTKE